MATTFGQQSFLDLKFNNHWVSEYGLIVTGDGSRYSEDLFPEFNHTTMVIPGKTGTIYWGTTISGRTIITKLATDGMTSRQYSNFKMNFKAGTFAELRFAESAYKYGFAYINDIPRFSFVPFGSTVTVGGIGGAPVEQYKDTLYKGECDLTFFMPDPYFYSNYYIGKSTNPVFDYTIKDWFIESGLPRNEWLSLEGGNIQLALGEWYGTAPSSATTIKCYHAGNTTARANLNFKKVYPASWATDGDFLVGLWPTNGYIIDDIVLSEPRVMHDIRYVFIEAGTRSVNWASYKPAFLIELQETIDSEIAGILRQMVNATGAGLKYETVAILKTAIQTTFINSKTYAFSINGIELQARMQSISTLTNTVPNPDEVFVIDDNIIDALNNKYITLLPSTGVAANGQLFYKIITSSQSLIDPEVYFKNTYE